MILCTTLYTDRYLGVQGYRLASAISRIYCAKLLPLVSHQYRHDKQHVELSNTLSFQALCLFYFPANELQTRSLYLWPIDNVHVLYFNMAATSLTMPHCHTYCKGFIPILTIVLMHVIIKYK